MSECLHLKSLGGAKVSLVNYSGPGGPVEVSIDMRHQDGGHMVVTLDHAEKARLIKFLTD